MPRFALLLCFALILLSPTKLPAQPVIAPDEGVKHISWEDAKDAIGQTVYVSGRIVTVGSSGRINFLNFDRKRPPDFVGIVFGENLKKFDGDLKSLYEGKLVEIRGLVVTYRDKPQIVITNPDQIRVLDELPKTEKISAKPVSAWSENPDEIVVATLNSLNLFDDVDDPYHNDEGTPAKPREELEHLAATIRKVNADVLAMQEVENRGYLQRFVDVFLADMGYHHIELIEGNDWRGIDVCLLSRAPIGEVVSRRHLAFQGPDGVERQFNRDVPAITVYPPQGDPIEFWVVHLKSKSDSEETSEPIRQAEATELRKLLDKRMTEQSDARILLLGDFNDTLESKSLTTILGSGSTSMWRLPATETSDSVEDPQYAGRPPIDFILSSPALKPYYIEESCKVMKAPAEVDGSDHDPVFARFRLK